MLILLSPAKSQNFKDQSPIDQWQKPKFEKEITQLVKITKELTPDKLASLMSISDKLASEVYEKYANFKKEFTVNSAKQALFTFSGDVYRSLDASSLSKEKIQYANEHLLMISGLYGLLKSLDLIQPYRLEMGSKIDINGQTLYQFWQHKLTDYLNTLLSKEKSKIVINLASKEYSSVFDKDKIIGQWIDIDFKEYKQGKYKIIGILAKRARGLMARYIVDNKIDKINELRKFNLDRYQLNEALSSSDHLVFTRN